MSKRVVCKNCGKTYILAGLEEEQIKLVNTAVDKFAEQILRILNSEADKDFMVDYSSATLNECVTKLLEVRKAALKTKDKKSFLETVKGFFKSS